MTALIRVPALITIASGSTFESAGAPLLFPPSPLAPTFIPRTPPSVTSALSIRCGGCGGDAADTNSATLDVTDNGEDSSESAISSLAGTGATCVLDLRPESVRVSSPVSIGVSAFSVDVFGAARVSGGFRGCRAAVIVPINRSTDDEVSALSLLLGTFPGDGEGTTDDPEQIEAGLHRLSSAAECLGSACDSAILMVAVCGSDERGKTSLHRSAGLMLAGLMNGVRRRIGRCGGGNEEGGKGRISKMKLTLILFPLDIEEDGTGSGKVDVRNDRSVAERLAQRLREFHAMGKANNDERGTESEGVSEDPFETVDIVDFGRSATGTCLSQLDAIVAGDGEARGRQGPVLSGKEMRKLIASAYEDIGGAGTIDFHEINM